MKLSPLLAVCLLSSFASSAALAGATEDAIAQAVTDYRADASRGVWINPIMPAATGSEIGRNSADERLTQIVSAYTRALLDRGGWENTILANSRYASGNPLLAVEMGSGMTIASERTTSDNAGNMMASVAR